MLKQSLRARVKALVLIFPFSSPKSLELKVMANPSVYNPDPGKKAEVLFEQQLDSAWPIENGIIVIL